MHNSRDDSGATFAIVLLIGLVLLTGGATLMWQRYRAAAQAQLALARAEEARARAMAEQQRLQALDAAKEADGIEGDAEDAIREILHTQQQAWNAGDIDQFMECYWKSDDLTFSSAGNLTRGWQSTLENYKRRYPTPAEMGQVSFDNIEVTPLGPDAAMVLGEWQLTRESGDLGGKFTLIFRRIDNNWLIVHDHTSRAESQP